ncbi:hypothetical protein OF83DRAFT_315478 [Amylostereum chailletii]|nr:hypothetical protein OF83DRAFT_315478 [Amylostereum chailletii]
MHTRLYSIVAVLHFFRFQGLEMHMYISFTTCNDRPATMYLTEHISTDIWADPRYIRGIRNTRPKMLLRGRSDNGLILFPSRGRRLLLSVRMLLPIAPNALHYDPDHPALGFSAVTTHFTVRHNRISIHASDGEADRVMQPGRHRGNNGPFYFERVSSANVNHPSFLHWREELGEYIAAVMFGRKNQGAARVGAGIVAEEIYVLGD